MAKFLAGAWKKADKNLVNISSKTVFKRRELAYGSKPCAFKVLEKYEELVNPRNLELYANPYIFVQ